jgi:heat shock protein HslJ
LGIAAWVFLSCSGRPTGPGDLPGVQGSWELQAYEVAGDSRRAIAEPGLYTADFTADSRVSARADCNRCSSSYSTAGAGLEIGALACTRAYCGDESFSDDYVAALDEAASFERSASSLVIRHPRGSLRFVPR